MHARTHAFTHLHTHTRAVRRIASHLISAQLWLDEPGQSLRVFGSHSESRSASGSMKLFDLFTPRLVVPDNECDLQPQDDGTRRTFNKAEEEEEEEEAEERDKDEEEKEEEEEDKEKKSEKREKLEGCGE